MLQKYLDKILSKKYLYKLKRKKKKTLIELSKHRNSFFFNRTKHRDSNMEKERGAGGIPEKYIESDKVISFFFKLY